MEASKEEVKEAILYLAKMCHKGDAYTVLLEGKSYTLPEAVKDIVYLIFVRWIDIRDICEVGNEAYEAYCLIQVYAQELEKKGFVEFNVRKG